MKQDRLWPPENETRVAEAKDVFVCIWVAEMDRTGKQKAERYILHICSTVETMKYTNRKSNLTSSAMS